MSVNGRGSGKCDNCGSNGSLYKCNKCGDERCWSCIQKIGGLPTGSEPCTICGKR